MPLSTKFKVLACAIAVVAIAVGLLLIFPPAILMAAAGFCGVTVGTGLIGAIPGIIGGGLLVAGIYGFHEAAMNKDVTWKSFWIMFGKGFVVGCVTHALSLAASAATLPVANFWECEPRYAAAGLGAICGFVSNGISNVINDRDFFDNCVYAIFIGGLVSFVCQSLLDGRPIEPPEWLKSLWKTIFESMDEVLHEVLSKICWTKVAELATKALSKLTPAILVAIKHTMMDLIGVLALWFKREVMRQQNGARTQDQSGTQGNQSTGRTGTTGACNNGTTNNAQRNNTNRTEGIRTGGSTYTGHQQQDFTSQEERAGQSVEPEKVEPEIVDQEDRNDASRRPPETAYSDETETEHEEQTSTPLEERTEQSPGPENEERETFDQEDQNDVSLNEQPEPCDVANRASNDDFVQFETTEPDTLETEFDVKEPDELSESECEEEPFEVFSATPEAEGNETADQEDGNAEQVDSSSVETIDAEQVPLHEGFDTSSNNGSVHRENNYLSREETETIQRESQEVAASLSHDNHPGSSGQSTGKAGIPIPVPLRIGEATTMRTVRNATAGKVAANKTHAKNMSAAGNARTTMNLHISSLHGLLLLHDEHKKISERPPPPKHTSQNKMFNTVASGTKLGVGVPAVSSQAGPSYVPLTTRKEAKKAKNQKEEKKLLMGETGQKANANSKWTKKTFGESQAVIGPQHALNGKPIASIHKLIAADEKGNYTLTNRKAEWPNFDGELSVVALMGMPSSGTTTLACSILFELGYSIPECDAFQMRIRLGVNAYVLHKHNLMIVECCEGIDPISKTNPQAPYGALLSELFVYLNCRAVIWNMPFWDDDVQRVKEYLRWRLCALQMAAVSNEGVGPRKLHVILRVHSENDKNHEDHRGHLENFLTEKKDGTELPKSPEEELFDGVIDMHCSKVSLLKFSNKAESLEQKDEYNRQIKDIADHVCTFKEHCPVTCAEFFEDAVKYWTKLKDSKTMETTTAKLSGAAIAAEAGDSDCGVKTWFAQTQVYLEQANDSAMKKKIADYNKEMKKKAEGYKKLPKEERSPQLFIESVLRMADIILRGALRLTDSRLKEQGVALGLKGMALLPKGNIPPVVEIAALKMMFFELGLMEVLKRSDVYRFFDDCWYLLYLLAYNGYRILSMEFNFWTAAQFHLKKTEFSGQFERGAYSEMLKYLDEMTNTDASRCVPERGSHCQDYFADIPVDQIIFDFEKECTTDVESIVILVARDPDTAPTEHDKFMQLPSQWFQTSKYAEHEFETDEKKQKSHEMVLGALSSRNFEILYKTIAIHFAEIVVKTPSLCTTLHDEVRVIGQSRMLVWQHVAGLAIDSLPLCFSLHNRVNLVEFLITNYIVPQKTHSLFYWAVRTLCQLHYAELCHKDTPELKSFVYDRCKLLFSDQNISNIHGLFDSDQRRRNLAERWTYTLLRCLESNVVGKLISYFCEIHHEAHVTSGLLSSLNAFLVRETESNYSESFYVIHRMNISKRLIAEFNDSVDALEKDKDNLSSSINMSILKNGCELVNALMWLFHLEDPDRRDFFADRMPDSPLRSSEIFVKLVRSAGRMVQFVSKMEARSNSRQVEEKNNHWRVQYYSLLLNLASVSGESHSAVLHKHGDNRSEIDHDELDKIVSGLRMFKKVDVTIKKRKQHKLVIVASDLLLSLAPDLLPGAWNGFHVMEGNLKAKIENLIKRLRSIDQETEQYKAWLCQQEQRRRRTQKPPVQVRSFQSTSRVEVRNFEVKYAISEVSYYLPETEWRCTTTSPDFTMIKEGHRQQKRTDGAADACAFLLFNKMTDVLVGLTATKHPFMQLLRLLKKLKKTDGSSGSLQKLELNLNNDTVKTILSLQHAIDLLLECGYEFTVEKTEIESKNFLTVTADTIRKDYIKDLHDSLAELKDQDMRLQVCSAFTAVDAASVETMEQELLPQSFFCPKKHKHYDLIHCLPINQLKERRLRLDMVPRHLRYVLVRVTLKTTVCYQAVFNPQETVARVLVQLQTSLGVTTTGLREKNSDQILPHDKELGDFPYVVHLHVC